MNRAEQLEQFRVKWDKCIKCPLSKLRTQVVHGYGNPEAKLVMVGEAPGEEEDLGGEPFVGPVGKLFNNILGAVGLKREDLWITNTCLCRPKIDDEKRKNRAPNSKEIEACRPRLQEEMGIVNPSIVVLAGNTPLYLATGKRGITKNRGWIINTDKRKVFATLHPKSLLYGSADQIRQKKMWTWEDWKQIAAAYEEMV